MDHIIHTKSVTTADQAKRKFINFCRHLDCDASI